MASFTNLAETSDPVHVFDEARDTFIASLSKRERILFAPCSSADDLLDGIKKLHVIQKQSHNRKISVCLKRIRGFSDALKPYFEVLTILVSSNPQYAALIWGALRLTLQVSILERRIFVACNMISVSPNINEHSLQVIFRASSKSLPGRSSA